MKLKTFLKTCDARSSAHERLRLKIWLGAAGFISQRLGLPAGYGRYQGKHCLPMIAARNRASRHEDLTPQIHDMDVGAEPDVVGEVPAGVVGIGIDYDVVAIP